MSFFKQAVDGCDIVTLACCGPVPDSLDDRDYYFEFKPEQPLGDHVDLRPGCPSVYNQMQMNSCTAHAVAGAFEYSVTNQKLPLFSPSRLFIWYNARAKLTGVQDAVKKNYGSMMRDAIKSLSPEANGVCSEADWPYEEDKYDKTTKLFVDGAKAAQKPPCIVTQHAHQHTAVKYESFQTTDQEQLIKELRQCLDRGLPFVFVMAHDDVLADSSKKDTSNKLHSLMGVGYDQTEQVFIIRNSWGETWGDKGHFYMPYTFLKYCNNFWSIELVSGQ
ncbi:cysteine proteinase [Ceratobasidium sp. AG-I]|nr:cysteine proteinase [Ceratobasidium sp. AG-I]